MARYKPAIIAYSVYNPEHTYWNEFGTAIVGDYICNIIATPLIRLRIKRQLELLYKAEKKEECLNILPERFTTITARKEILKMMETQGTFAPWAGLAVNTLEFLPNIYFARTLYTLLHQIKDTDSLNANLYFGNIIGIIAAFVCHPLQVINCRIATTFGEDPPNTYEAAQKIVMEDGIMGLYKGFGISLFFYVCITYDCNFRLLAIETMDAAVGLFPSISIYRISSGTNIFRFFIISYRYNTTI